MGRERVGVEITEGLRKEGLLFSKWFQCSTKLTTQTALPNYPSKLTSSQADLIGQQGKRRLYFSGLYIEFSTRVPLDPTFACI